LAIVERDIVRQEQHPARCRNRNAKQGSSKARKNARQGGKMAAAAAGIFNHAMTAGQALTGKSVTPMASPTSGAGNTNSTGDSSDTSSNSATISANDFLTLLVTEMQNQDPTADTDPNEYINQLVQVNSLEQLIDINQTLSGDAGSVPTGSGGSDSTQTAAAISSPSATGAGGTNALQHSATHSAGAFSAAQSGAVVANLAPANLAPGNLSVPATNPAAQRVGHALDGRTRAGQVSGGPLHSKDSSLAGH
jgi:flagellar basal-body rod modification protein FlgD